MTSAQRRLFDAPPVLPPGFRYQSDLLSPVQERELLAQFADLSFREFEFHGFLGKRRTVLFGWHYDFNGSRLRPTQAIPDFLLGVREEAARFATIPADALAQVLLIEYGPGAGIGWHKDKEVFGDVVGVSLRAPCVFRLRRRTASGWERASIVAQPRSAYLLHGAARAEWAHSIPPVESLRYSITFRSIRLP